MGKLIYTTISSLDGYVADAEGNFAWAAPGKEVHEFVNDLERTIGTYLCGRRTYEVLQFWESLPTPAEQPEAMRDYAAIWQAADKIVVSKTMESVSAPRTQLHRTFQADVIRDLKLASDRDIGIGGPTLAAQGLQAGLVDECHFFLVPVVVGGGTPSLPSDLRTDLELLDHRRFENGTVHLHYRVS